MTNFFDLLKEGKLPKGRVRPILPKYYRTEASRKLVLHGYRNQDVIHSSDIDRTLNSGASAQELESFINIQLQVSRDEWKKGMTFYSEKYFFQSELEMKKDYTEFDICGDTYYCKRGTGK